MTGPALSLPVTGARIRLEHNPDGAVAAVRLADDAVVGAIVVTGADAGTLFIERLCVEEAERGYGAGTEAAHLLVAAARAAGFKRLEAWTPPDRGLGVYFWMRMGFRPRFGRRDGGGILFERSLGGQP